MATSYSFFKDEKCVGPLSFQLPPSPQDMEKLTKIHQQLSVYSGHMFRVIVQSRPDRQPGISYPYGVITLETELLKCSPHVIAFVLAHEWGHEMLRHPDMAMTGLYPHVRDNCEDEADKYATQFTVLQGYSLDEVYKFNYILNPLTAPIRNEKIRQTAVQLMPKEEEFKIGAVAGG